jgi:hypothetical protein
MKKLTIIALLLGCWFFTQAKTVQQAQIRLFAERFISEQASDNYEIASIEAIHYQQAITKYLVRLSPTGFILLSADDTVEPLLAYSFENEALSPREWPEHMAWWMNETSEKILFKTKDTEALRHKGWDEGAQLKSANVITVQPLIPVRWDQGNRWNQFCPADEKGPGGYTYVGCVAVSMAQAMSKYKAPTIGNGRASYIHKTYGTQTVDFSKEAPYYWDSMPSGSANEHNARLLYHCAVTVNMDFGADGSGAYTETASGALKAYFNYSKTTKSVNRVDDDEEWKKILIDNLAAGYPLIYHGDGNNGQAGHAWNIDGVDVSGLFHVNWGWSGSMNGYYNINDLAPGSNDFTKNQGAILGIKPKVPGPIDISLEKTSVRENKPAGTPVSAIHIDDEYPENPYTYQLKGNPVVIGDGYAAPKFYVENDTLKTIEPFDFDKRQSYIVFIQVADTLGNTLEKMFEIAIEQAVGVPSMRNAGMKIYPNPFNQMVMIETPIESEAAFFSILGKKVYSVQLESGTHSVDVSHLPKGLYMVRMNNREGSWQEKIFKQ